jgi:hypothetical protein
MKQAMKKARGRIKGNIKSNRASEYHGRELNKVLDELEEQVKYIERIKKASADELGHELINVGKKNYMLSHWGVSRLFMEESLPDGLWQERVVLEAAKAKKSEISLELLEGVLRIRRNPVALCAIGQSGTQEAVQLLKRLASKEKTMRALRNYYFCLLLTGRPEAVEIVKEAAKSQEKSNIPAAGKWALQEYAKMEIGKDGGT